MHTALIEESRHTWLLIVARDATANTGGPLMLKLSATRCGGGSEAIALRKLRSSAVHAAC